MTYNKLVRDKIVSNLINKGYTVEWSLVSNADIRACLHRKLEEEVNEFIDSLQLEELADIIEVIHAIAKSMGTTIDEVESIRIKKAEEKGSFERGIFLESVEETI